MPSKYDVAPYGTMCKVMGDNDSSELYVQLGREIVDDWRQPGVALGGDWKPIGKLLEGAFKDKLDDPIFIQECLQKYQALTK